MSKYEGDPQYEHKFFVVKDSIIQRELDFLQEQESVAYHNVVNFLHSVCIAAKGKEYLVVNQDEPYADKVWELIKSNEKKEIVAFVGRAGSGKDYQSNLLVEKGFKKMSFANALRKMAFTCFGLNFEEGLGQYEYLKANDCITLTLQDKEEIKLNFRTFLERLGTQGIRHYDNDFWVNCLIKDIKESNVKKICISDLRFTNEYIKLYEFAKENGYEFKCIFCDYHSDRYQDKNDHESARFSNYLANQGFKDLQEVTPQDCMDFLTVQTVKESTNELLKMKSQLLV